MKCIGNIGKNEYSISASNEPETACRQSAIAVRVKYSALCGAVFDLAKIMDCGMIDAAKSKWGQVYGKTGISLRGGGHIIQDHG